MPDDEMIIKEMARAMCRAHDLDPDAVVNWRGDGGEATTEPAWLTWVMPARAQLAAHRAMVKAEKEQDNA